MGQIILNLCYYLLCKIINNHTKTVISSQLCQYSIRLHAYNSLFIELCNILNTEFNLGGVDNFKNFKAQNIPLFEIVSLGFHILNYGINKNEQKLIDIFIINYNNLVKSSKDDNYNKAFENLCIWLLCNFNELNVSIKSIIGPHFNKCFKDCKDFFFKLFENEDMAKLFTKFIIKNLENLHEIIFKKLKKKINWLCINSSYGKFIKIFLFSI